MLLAIVAGILDGIDHSGNVGKSNDEGLEVHAIEAMKLLINSLRAVCLVRELCPFVCRVLKSRRRQLGLVDDSSVLFENDVCLNFRNTRLLLKGSFTTVS